MDLYRTRGHRCSFQMARGYLYSSPEIIQAHPLEASFIKQRGAGLAIEPVKGDVVASQMLMELYHSHNESLRWILM